MKQLIHTSASRGLWSEWPGYVTVGCSSGVPQEFIEILENESSDGSSHHEVVRVWFIRETLVLSRIVTIARDFGHRQARLAHHLMVSPAQNQCEIGSLALMDDQLWVNEWTDPPRQLPEIDTVELRKRINARHDVRSQQAMVSDSWLSRAQGLPRQKVQGVISALHAPPEVPIRVALACFLQRSSSCNNLWVSTTTSAWGGRSPSLVVLAFGEPLPRGTALLPECTRRGAQPDPSKVISRPITRGPTVRNKLDDLPPPPTVDPVSVIVDDPVEALGDTGDLGEKPPHPVPALLRIVLVSILGASVLFVLVILFMMLVV